LTGIQLLYNAYPPAVCELCLANLYIWGKVDNPRISFLNETLLIYLDTQIEPGFYLEPIGSSTLEPTTRTLLDRGHKLSRISESFTKKLNVNEFNITLLPDHTDYILSTQNLALLQGRHFDGKRNHIHKFNRLYNNYRYVPVTKSDHHAVVSLYEVWSEQKKQRNELDLQSYQIQLIALNTCFDLFDELNFFGGALYIQDELKAFILASPLTQQTANIHFFYGDQKFSGIYTVLLQAACEKSFAEYPYLNFEQDLGIPGLKKSKESYHPVNYVRKFSLA